MSRISASKEGQLKMRFSWFPSGGARVTSYGDSLAGSCSGKDLGRLTLLFAGLFKGKASEGLSG